ncbi:unnamed protein product [Rhizoctonia solani]|uniref:UBC core domain-containing protein n=1 Tax=Rhizoctonia solani TaxID=456999 RepID=A0A8H2Y0A4_9AGAM|nr:unnamed protein product [Rhizoctonia solani]
MLNLFNKLRLCLFAIVFVGASIVLGICGYLTSRLSSTGIHDFLIFSLVITAFTIVVVVLLALRSQPRIDAIVLFILVALWLTMGAYTQDIIGHQFCYALRGQTIPARNGTMSAENYCRRMKTVLAFSWANFVFLVLWLVGLLILVIKIYARGNRDIWGNSMSDVTLFTESPINKPEYPPMAPATNLPTMPGQTFVYYPNTSAALQPQVIQQKCPFASQFFKASILEPSPPQPLSRRSSVSSTGTGFVPVTPPRSPSPGSEGPLPPAMRSEELIKWTTMGISCAIGVQMLLFVLPSLRPYGTIIQILLALGACGGLAYVAATDRRQNGNLTAEGHARNELKMIGMFFLLWLMFAIMFRMTGVGGATGHSAAPAAVAPTSNTHQNHNLAEPCGPFARTNATCFSPTHTSPKRRIETDVMKMLMSDYKVSLVNDNMQEFYVMFNGPEETAFAGGVWKIHVELPDQYPYKSPSIGFMNKIFHPNIDELSGSVCLDVINQTWSPMFDMINIFESFLPQLLRYPNPSDPLNGEAAALLMREPKSYEAKVREYVTRYASKEAAEAAAAEDEEEEEEDAEMSSVGSISDDEGNA